jgi:acetyl esterase/lipase
VLAHDPKARCGCVGVYTQTVRQAAELGVDPARVGIGGDSAGGNLAVAACLVARERGYPKVVLHFLFCPVSLCF